MFRRLLKELPSSKRGYFCLTGIFASGTEIAVPTPVYIEISPSTRPLEIPKKFSLENCANLAQSLSTFYSGASISDVVKQTVFQIASDCFVLNEHTAESEPGSPYLVTLSPYLANLASCNMDQIPDDIIHEKSVGPIRGTGAQCIVMPRGTCLTEAYSVARLKPFLHPR